MTVEGRKEGREVQKGRREKKRERDAYTDTQTRQMTDGPCDS